MEELIELLKGLQQSSTIPNLDKYDHKIVLICICKTERYDLIQSNPLTLDIKEDENTKTFIEYILSDEDILYYLDLNGYTLSAKEIDDIREYILKHYKNDNRRIEFFLSNFFPDKEDLDTFIETHMEDFREIIINNPNDIPYKLQDNQIIINIILKERITTSIKNIEKYNATNLKELSLIIKEGYKTKYYNGTLDYANNIFKYINELTKEEFYYLITVLKDKESYERTYNKNNLQFENLISNNIDYLIEMTTIMQDVPQCLVESPIYRDECIKRNRIDLAIKCILPKDIITNPELLDKYCKELNIDKKTFETRYQWLLKYSEKNNNIFNTFVTSMLQEEPFNIKEYHLERFINDVSIQMKYTSLNPKEMTFVNKILDKYNYQTFDITDMISMLINNITNYKELINNIDIAVLTEEETNNLIAILHHPENVYNIKTLEDIKNIKEIKKQQYIKNKEKGLLVNKNNLLKYIFNIDLKEAMIINNHYCYMRDKKILDRLYNSELPKEIYNMLLILNKIVETTQEADLDTYYNEFNNKEVYNSPIPLDTYLRSIYTELYSNGLYQPKEGPKEIHQETTYNGEKVDICIPQSNFGFMVHCVGSCSLKGDEIDSNYCTDWEGRPQIQDHIVACSYVTQDRIYSLRSEGSVTYGFSTLEGSAIYGMGDTDIDSIGPYARSYSVTRDLMDQGTRAHFFPPSIMIENTSGYNEIVIERRNITGETFKRRPDYIIMRVDTIENKNNFITLDELFNTKFKMFTKEEQEKIKITKYPDYLKILLNHIKEIKEQFNIELTDKQAARLTASMLEKAKYYQESLRAAQEFKIPLIVIDESLYFKKALQESTIYTEEEKQSLLELYNTLDSDNREKLYDKVIRSIPYSTIIKKEEPITKITVSL